MYQNGAFRNVTDTVMAHFTVHTDENGGPYHSPDCRTHASYGRWRGSQLGLCLWDLWWTKWQWDRFLPEYIFFPCQCHCTNVPHLL